MEKEGEPSKGRNGVRVPQTPCCPGVAISEPDEKETEAPAPSLCVQIGDSTAPGPWGSPPMDAPWLELLFLGECYPPLSDGNKCVSQFGASEKTKNPKERQEAQTQTRAEESIN